MPGARYSEQFGRASAPRWPQRAHRSRGPIDGTGTSSDNAATSTTLSWLHPRAWRQTWTSFLAARLGARVAHHMSKRRPELCFAMYLIMVCGQFGSSLALT
jgi:hypothetical protein